MTGFTSKPLVKVPGLNYEAWSESQMASWLAQTLVPWLNNRSGLVLISSQEVTTDVTSVDFTEGLTSEFDRYLFTIDGYVPATDATALHLRISDDGGVTFKAGASDYRWTDTVANESGAWAGLQDAADSEIQITQVIGNATGESLQVDVMLSMPASTTLYKIFKYDAAQYSSDPNSRRNSGTGLYFAATAAINGVRFIPSSGNIASGLFCLYGLRQ